MAPRLGALQRNGNVYLYEITMVIFACICALAALFEALFIFFNKIIN